MAVKKLSEFASQTGAAVAAGDLFVTVDVSDASMAATGTDKTINVAELRNVFQASLVAVGVKTGTYNANANEFVPCDTTAAGFTVTLPTAPADNTLVGVKHVVQGGTNAVTISCGGSDVFNKTGGSTTGTLPLLNQSFLLKYKATGAIWYVVAIDLPLSQLDLRYDAAGAAATAQAASLQKSSNLSDLANAATARTNLGLGTLATQSGTFSGASSGTNTGDQTNITGNAGTATTLQTSRAINGTSFNGSADITIGAIPSNSKSAAYTTVLGDAGQTILHAASDNTARTFTIDSNANVAYPVGTTITFVNLINTVTISITTDTMTLAGSSTTGSRTLAVNGIAVALKVGATSWLVSGTGLT